MIRFLRTHTPLIRTMLLLIVFLLCIGLALSAFQKRDGSTIPLESDSWQSAPALTFDENRSPERGWNDYTEGDVKPASMKWLRIPLPQNEWDDPHLFVMNVGGMKVYDGNQIVFTYQMTNQDKRIKNFFRWKMVPLQSPTPAYIDVLVRYSSHDPVSVSMEFGNKASLLTRILHTDLDNLILGALLLFSTVIGLGLYTTQRDLLYLYFSLLAFAGGYAAIVCNYLLQVIWDYPLLGHFQDACMPLGTYAFIGSLEHVFPGVHRRTIRFLRWVMLGYTVAMIFLALVNTNGYIYAKIVFAPLFVVLFASMYWTIWSAYRIKRDVESIWIMAGFTSLITIATIHMYRIVLHTFVPEPVKGLLAWTNRLPADLIFWGLFVFVVCLIRVIMYRYTAMNRQLTEFNRSLENVVQTRTKQLQESTEQLEITHERLGASMRENAEALAEAMILEERHRITGSIHDTVGHTLGATIIQLEAAKRLLSRDHSLAEEKLEASQRLVRRGLEDIRQSVRLLREDASYYDLPGSIGALIRETEHSANCKIESRLDPLPVNLSTLQKRILFQTVHEGLSFGVRHRHDIPLQFRLIVRSDADTIRLKLTHIAAQGYSQEDIGFGLRAISEHAAKIGGKITTEADSAGFALTLTLPLTKADHWII